jgi:hypothetical protein
VSRQLFLDLDRSQRSARNIDEALKKIDTPPVQRAVMVLMFLHLESNVAENDGLLTLRITQRAAAEWLNKALSLPCEHSSVRKAWQYWMDQGVFIIISTREYTLIKTHRQRLQDWYTLKLNEREEQPLFLRLGGSRPEAAETALAVVDRGDSCAPVVTRGDSCAPVVTRGDSIGIKPTTTTTTLSPNPNHLKPTPPAPIGQPHVFRLWKNAKDEDFSEGKNVQLVFERARAAQLLTDAERLILFRFVASTVRLRRPGDNLAGLITHLLRGGNAQLPWRARGNADDEKQARAQLQRLDTPAQLVARSFALDDGDLNTRRLTPYGEAARLKAAYQLE